MPSTNQTGQKQSELDSLVLIQNLNLSISSSPHHPPMQTRSRSKPTNSGRKESERMLQAIDETSVSLRSPVNTRTRSSSRAVAAHTEALSSSSSSSSSSARPQTSHDSSSVSSVRRTRSDVSRLTRSSKKSENKRKASMIFSEQSQPEPSGSSKSSKRSARARAHSAPLKSLTVNNIATGHNKAKSQAHARKQRKRHLMRQVVSNNFIVPLSIPKLKNSSQTSTSQLSHSSGGTTETASGHASKLSRQLKGKEHLQQATNILKKRLRSNSSKLAKRGGVKGVKSSRDFDENDTESSQQHVFVKGRNQYDQAHNDQENIPP